MSNDGLLSRKIRPASNAGILGSGGQNPLLANLLQAANDQWSGRAPVSPMPSGFGGTGSNDAIGLSGSGGGPLITNPRTGVSRTRAEWEALGEIFGHTGRGGNPDGLKGLPGGGGAIPPPGSTPLQGSYPFPDQIPTGLEYDALRKILGQQDRKAY